MLAAEIACYALTPAGAHLARRLAHALENLQEGRVCMHVYVPPSLQQEGDMLCDSLPLLLSQTYTQYRAHIFVTAASIAVRCIAPHLAHARPEPAVLFCDEGGRFAVSLLSGHWGGGNALAKSVAESLGCTAVITTPGDCQRLAAVDILAQEAGCAVVDWHVVKKINAALLRGDSVQLRDPLNLLQHAPAGYFLPVCLPYIDQQNLSVLDPARPAVSVDWRLVPAADNLLRLAVPALHVGVGCRRGVSCDEITAAITQTLHKAGLEPQAVAGLASATGKEDEAGLVEAARDLLLPLRFFPPEELADAAELTATGMAAQIFGVDHIRVAESAAMLGAGGEDAALLVPTVKFGDRITVAVAVGEVFLPSVPR